MQSARDGNLEAVLSYGQPSHYSVNQQVYIHVNTTAGTMEAGLWRLRLTAGTIVNGEYNLWLPTLEAVGNRTFFSESTAENTLTIPSTAQKAITVAGYNDRLDSLVDYSGRGSATGCPLKPDLAAPSNRILAPKVGGGYDAFTGTSMAAPFVTGAAALMMQWGIVEGYDPYLYGERVKAFLRIGAKRSKSRS